MKLQIKRVLLTIAGILLVSSLCAVDTRADVLYEPNDDFFEKHRDECSYEDRDYFTDGPDGEVILYESPESGRETGRIPNGALLHLYWLYMDRTGVVWALVDRKQDPKSGELMSGWFPYEYASVKYDFTEFIREHRDELVKESGKVPAEYAGKEIRTWEYPGGEMKGVIFADRSDNLPGYNITYTDEEGRKWFPCTYYYGHRNFWCCLDALTADDGSGPDQEESAVSDTSKAGEPDEKEQDGRITPGPAVPAARIAGVLAAVVVVMGVSIVLLIRMKK